MDNDALDGAWQMWDARPGDEASSKRFEKVVQEYCRERGISATSFRKAIAIERRDGFSRQDAIIRALSIVEDDEVF